MNKYPAIEYGQLPVDAINAGLGTELVPGLVRLSAQAHRHMAVKHPADYETCIAALPDAIAAPSFVGQAPHHAENFELIRRIARSDGKVVLVAIGLEPDHSGAYRVRTCYLIGLDDVSERRSKGRLKTILWP